jgi:hypothetical protein
MSVVFYLSNFHSYPLIHPYLSVQKAYARGREKLSKRKTTDVTDITYMGSLRRVAPLPGLARVTLPRLRPRDMPHKSRERRLAPAPSE